MYRHLQKKAIFCKTVSRHIPTKVYVHIIFRILKHMPFSIRVKKVYTRVLMKLLCAYLRCRRCFNYIVCTCLNQC